MGTAQNSNTLYVTQGFGNSFKPMLVAAADIAVYGYTHLAQEGGFELQNFKHVTAWISRVQEQPGYKPIDQLLTGEDQKIAA